MALVRRHLGWGGEPALFTAPAQTGSVFDIRGTPGDDEIKGSRSADDIDASQGGDDAVHARGGDDMIYFGAAFTGADQVSGGKGTDTVILDGDYSAGIEVQADSFFKVEKLVLEGGSYVITGELAAATGADRLLVYGFSLNADQSLNYDVATSGDVAVVGGSGDDVLRGSSDQGVVTFAGYTGDDVLIGGAGEYHLQGGAGADHLVSNSDMTRFEYFGTEESAPKEFDTIERFQGKLSFYFDSDTATTGIQHGFHFDKTADRTGCILIEYDAGLDETVVKVFTDADHRADMVVHLTGDVSLTPADFFFG